MTPPERVIYFARRADGVGPVKIGCTANLKERIRHVAFKRKEELVVLATAPGSFRDEKNIHGLLSSDRLDGEWFSPSAATLAIVEHAATHGALPITNEPVAAPPRTAIPAQDGPFSVGRMMGLTTAAALVGGQSELAEAMGIQPRSLRAKFNAERGISSADLLSAADACEARAVKISAHARKLRDVANATSDRKPSA